MRNPLYTTKIGEMIRCLGEKTANGRLLGDNMADYLAKYDGEDNEVVVSLRCAMKALHEKYDK